MTLTKSARRSLADRAGQSGHRDRCEYRACCLPRRLGMQRQRLRRPAFRGIAEIIGPAPTAVASVGFPSPEAGSPISSSAFDLGLLAQDRLAHDAALARHPRFPELLARFSSNPIISATTDVNDVNPPETPARCSARGAHGSRPVHRPPGVQRDWRFSITCAITSTAGPLSRRTRFAHAGFKCESRRFHRARAVIFRDKLFPTRLRLPVSSMHSCQIIGWNHVCNEEFSFAPHYCN